jgi:type II secretory pathway pseudopilin PulG
MNFAVVISVVALIVSLASVVVAIRSARATERSVDIQQDAFDLEQRREAQRRVREAEERAPTWAAADEGEAGYFEWDGATLEGRLLNEGLSSAAIDLAVIDLPRGGRCQLQTRVDPAGAADGGWSSHPIVPPGAMLRVQGEVSEVDASAPGRPSIYLDYTANGVAQTGALGATVELLRSGEDRAGRPRWRVGEVKYAVRA